MDLKPANVLLSDDGFNVKLIDFGISKKTEETIMDDGLTGTMKFMSPEQQSGTLSKMCDIWSFGCILMTLLTGEEPYGNDDNFGVSSTQLSPLDFYKKNGPDLYEQLIAPHPELVRLMTKCFHFDHKMRPSAQDLAKEQFFGKSNEQLLFEFHQVVESAENLSSPSFKNILF